jgi:hypothetical protein
VDAAALRRAAAALAVGAALAAAAPAGAGEADVLEASADCVERTCRFRVTVRHADQGFDHYADRYEVVAPDGRVLATRVLQHPHVAEQPFTRDLDGVRVPPGIASVRVRAHDSVHGFGGPEATVEIPDEEAGSH